MQRFRLLSIVVAILTVGALLGGIALANQQTVARFPGTLHVSGAGIPQGDLNIFVDQKMTIPLKGFQIETKRTFGKPYGGADYQEFLMKSTIVPSEFMIKNTGNQAIALPNICKGAVIYPAFQGSLKNRWASIGYVSLTPFVGEQWLSSPWTCRDGLILAPGKGLQVRVDSLSVDSTILLGDHAIELNIDGFLVPDFQPPPVASIKLMVNGSENPGAVAYDSLLEVSWGANTPYCIPEGDSIADRTIEKSPGFYTSAGRWGPSFLRSSTGEIKLSASVDPNGFGRSYKEVLQIGLFCFGPTTDRAVRKTISIPVLSPSQ